MGPLQGACPEEATALVVVEALNSDLQQVGVLPWV